MKFKKVDILITENLSRAQLKEKVLTELNKIARQDSLDRQTIHYIASIHDVVKGKFWVCMDTETRRTINAPDELMDLHSVMRYTIDDKEKASNEFFYSSRYIEDNFNRTEVFESRSNAVDARLLAAERSIVNNKNDIDDKHTRLTSRVTELENYRTANSREVESIKNRFMAFRNETMNTLAAIDRALTDKISISAKETVVETSNTSLNMNIDNRKVTRLTVTGSARVNLEPSTSNVYAEKRLILRNRSSGTVTLSFRLNSNQSNFNVSGNSSAIFNIEFIDGTVLVSRRN